MKALVIDEPWISLILQGSKTWETRKTGCSHRGPIALIRKGSGQVVGLARVIDSLAELDTPQSYAAAERFHSIPADRQERAFADGWRTPWVLTDVRTLGRPVSYQHPSGAVIWVNLGADVVEQIEDQLGDMHGILEDGDGTPDRLVPRPNAQRTQSSATASVLPVFAETPPARVKTETGEVTGLYFIVSRGKEMGTSSIPSFEVGIE
jgi:hypothetical protein